MYAISDEIREREPLFAAASQLSADTSKGSSKIKRYGSLLVCLLVSCAVIALFAYNYPSSPIIPHITNVDRVLNDEFDDEVNTQPPLNDYTKNKQSLLHSHSKIFGEQKIETVIRYEADSSPYDEYWMSYAQWNAFHADLVTQQGFDIEDDKRSFVFEINDQSAQSALHPNTLSDDPERNSNLQCFTRYAYTEGNKDSLEPGASVGVNCLDDDRQGAAQMVGCVTYHPDNYGFTSGETIGWLDIVGSDGNIRTEPRCKSWHREGSQAHRFPIGVAARCCRASNAIESHNPYTEALYVNYGMFFNSASYYDRHNGHCFHSLNECNNVEKGMDRGPVDGSSAVMCTTYYGQWIGYGDEPGCNQHEAPADLDCGGWTGQPLGTRYDPELGCQTGRGEAGYIAQRMGCAGSTQGSLMCMWQDATYAVLNSATMQWHSRMECPIGFAMADCNGYIVHADVHTCTDGVDAPKHRGISFGAFYSHTDQSTTACVAVGSESDIRAQASCCRIADTV